MAVEFVETTEFTLSGDFVRVRMASGKDVREHAVPIGLFIENHLKAKAVIAQWHARDVAPVVPIESIKRKR